MTDVDVNAFVILLAAIFTNNILLSYFLGMCSFIAVSNTVPTALGLGAAVTFVSTLTVVVSWPIYRYVLVPFGLEYLQFIVFIVVIASSRKITLPKFVPPCLKILTRFGRWTSGCPARIARTYSSCTFAAAMSMNVRCHAACAVFICQRWVRD